MNLNRRQSLGAFIAGIFSTGSIAENRNLTQPAPPGLNPVDMNNAIKHANSYKTAQEISEIKSVIKGELNAWQKKYMEKQYDATFLDIKSLKSVTNATKERMYLNHRKKKTCEGWIENAKVRLLELMGITKHRDQSYYSAYPDEGSSSRGSYDVQQQNDGDYR